MAINVNFAEYGNLVLLIDEPNKRLLLASEAQAERKVGSAVKGEWNNTNAELFAKICRHYSEEGYKVPVYTSPSLEGRTDLEPVFQISFLKGANGRKFPVYGLNYILPKNVPHPMTKIDLSMLTPAERAKLQGSIPAPKPKAKPKAKGIEVVMLPEPKNAPKAKAKRK